MKVLKEDDLEGLKDFRLDPLAKKLVILISYRTQLSKTALRAKKYDDKKKLDNCLSKIEEADKEIKDLLLIK